MGSPFALVSEAELEDYRRSLDWYGCSEEDFELTEQLDPPRKGDAKPSTGLARVHRKSTGVTKRYRLGVGGHWTYGFDQDLWRGVFKAR